MKRFLLVLSLFLICRALHASPELAKEGFTSAKVCGECHVAIYEGWKESMHANAVTDPVFYPIFLETSRQTGGQTDFLCLSCHAPTVRQTRDTHLTNPITLEGVTCDFCHSVTESKPGAADPLTVVIGKKKWGPLKGITSPAHEVSYSDLFEQSRLCGSCHEYTNKNGAPLFETFSEWQKSPQAKGASPKEGKTCQSCHMPPLKGLVVPPRVKPTQEIYINSHEAAGGHSIEQVRKAVTLRIGESRREGDKIHATVYLENVGSGHKVPTGMPTRKLVLRLQAFVGGAPLYAAERIFQKILVDKKGEVITKDADLFLKAVKVSQDNRLEPGEVRAEDFTFYAPEGKKIEIRLSLYYLYQPRIIHETEMKVILGEEKTTLPEK
ncbi:MAG: hypothetical protein HYS22_04885 [Deltaproteobacteria bacterium]|nr:hypothetical protein [Deltaproteobacteria bacterium]